MGDVAQVIIALSSLVAAIGAALAAILTARNGRAIEEVHRSTNGKMEELMKVTRESAEAKGRMEERANIAASAEVVKVESLAVKNPL